MANKTVYPFGIGGQMPSGIPIVDDLVTGGADKALSAEQGKVLNENFQSQVISVDGTHLIIGKRTADSYVTDGLIFNLDGIDKGQNTGSWTDLVGGIVFTNTNCVFQEKYVEFPSGSFAYLTAANANFAQAVSNGTIEICYEGDISGANRFIFYPNKDNNIMLSYATSLNAFVIGSKNPTTIYTPSVTSGVSRLSLNVSSAIQNLQSLVKAGTGYFSEVDTNLYVGRRGGSTASNAFVGKIYAIRIYNRQLSDYEMRNNQIYDEIRFLK